MTDVVVGGLETLTAVLTVKNVDAAGVRWAMQISELRSYLLMILPVLIKIELDWFEGTVETKVVAV